MGEEEDKRTEPEAVEPDEPAGETSVMERPAAPEEGSGPETEAAPGRRPADRRRVARAAVAAVLVAGLAVGGGWLATSGLRQAAPDAAETAGAVDDEALSVVDVAEAVSTLEFDGKDVSAPADQVSVAVSAEGNVVVTQRSADDEATMVDATARRSAALARVLEGASVEVASASAGEAPAADTGSNEATSTGDAAQASASGSDEVGAAPVKEVTWVATDADGNVQVAVSNDPAKAPGKGTTAELVEGSKGHTMTDSAHDAAGLGDVPATGGDPVTGADGSKIEPAKKEGPATTEAAGSEDEQGSASGSGSKASTPSQQQASGSSSGGSSSSGASSSGAPAHEHTWEAVTHEEPTYSTEDVYEEQPVYEKQSYDVFIFNDGHVEYSESAAGDYNFATHIGYYVETRYETVQTGTKSVKVGTRQVQTGTTTVTDYYRCTGCGATK